MNAPAHPHAAHCPECGAPRVTGLTCWELLGALLAWEYDGSSPARRTLPHRGVYNLQHPAQFAEATLAAFQTVFSAHLDHGLGIAEIRRRVVRVARIGSRCAALRLRAPA